MIGTLIIINDKAPIYIYSFCRAEDGNRMDSFPVISVAFVYCKEYVVMENSVTPRI